ncbi:MAG TPA: TolC family outer membrane protein [Steroidobacteraceae bacterium]|jgi:outer membrane protein|nr:TolC family outer membrane protein [Steroidobacteraceae bacterium]
MGQTLSGGRWALVAAALAFAAPAAWANDLLQLYHLAQNHDATLQAALAQRDAAIEAKPQALALLLPQVSANASAEREKLGEQLIAPQTVASTTITGCQIAAGAATQVCFGDGHGYGLNLSQTLWSFQSFSQLREASATAAAAEANLLAAQQSLMLRVAQAYFGVLSAHDALVTNQGARQSYSVLLNQARGRQQTGVGARADSEQAQAYYDQTAQAVIDSQNGLDDAELLLSEVSGAPATLVAALREQIPLESPDPASVDEWVTAALKDNPLVRAAQLQVDAADRDIDVQHGKALPSVVLAAGRNRGWGDLTIGGNSQDDQIGVSVTWPLFQGGAVASQVRQSRALWKQALALYAGAERDAERLTRSSYRNVVTGIARIAAARRNVDSAGVALEASKRSLEFALGTGAEYNLLQTQNQYFVAQLLYSQTRYDYLTALLTLKQQAGRLAEADLATIDALLIEHAP